MGLNVVTDEKPVTVVRKDGVSKAGKAYSLYSLMYSYKNGEEWKNVFVDAQFKKGVDLANKTKITISNAFFTGSEYNGQTKPKIFALDFKVVGGNGNGSNAAEVDNSWMNIGDGIGEELPFA